jgi:3-phosphoshikimate 1-carboxyvinyltransferase
MEKADLKARSPWSTLNAIKEAEFMPLDAKMDKEITIPGSKSFTNRALIMAALAEGNSQLSGVLRSDDSFWCIDALTKLGVPIHVDGDSVYIQGGGGEWPFKQGELYIGASGTIARFLPGALASASAGQWEIKASERMSQRPVKPLIDALNSLGAQITYTENPDFYPLQIQASGLSGGNVGISGKVSSQFISGLLIASPYARKSVHVKVTDHIVQHAYVKITLDLMKQFGGEVDYAADLSDMIVQPIRYKGRDIELEADASTAGYFFALAALNNGRIRITNLSYDTNQPDVKLVDVLEKMGCIVIKGNGFLEIHGTDKLKGGFEISMKEMSDQALTLAVLAAFADGPIKITDIGHIRHHESNRIKVMVDNLASCGIKTEEHEDGVTVFPGTITPATLSSYDDHRVAMAFSLIGTKVSGIKIMDPGCVSKTCPTYFELLQKVGAQVNFR